MAEILLSLTIIGVVAAITLPSLTGNINERTWNTQRKALYARMSQAIALMPALNGYGTLTEGNESASAVDTAAETFVTEGLSKVLKINNICDNEHLEDCGLSAKITTPYGDIISNFTTTNGNTLFGFNSKLVLVKNTKAVAFETANGESIIVYYNPQCSGNSGLPANRESMQQRMCVNFVYDLNGAKGPNTIGKDIGVITAFNSTDSNVVSPYFRSYGNNKTPWWDGFYTNPFHGSHTPSELTEICRKKMGDEYRAPNIYELSSLFINENLFQVRTYTGAAISATRIMKTSGGFWQLGLNSGSYDVRWDASDGGSTQGFVVHCIER